MNQTWKESRKQESIERKAGREQAGRRFAGAGATGHTHARAPAENRAAAGIQGRAIQDGQGTSQACDRIYVSDQHPGKAEKPGFDSAIPRQERKSSMFILSGGRLPW